MKTESYLTVITLLLTLSFSAQAGDGVIDLTSLANYANQAIPAYINATNNRDNTPGNNAITDKGATLGKVLFYDKRLSKDSTVSCSTCHQQARAFSDTATASTGVAGTTGRHSMRLVNARFAQEVRFFWDERATSLENQTTQPIKDHAEMGFSNTLGDPAFADLVTRLTALDEYRVLFAFTFGTATITEERVQQALAQFVRSIQSFDSKFDVGRAQVNANNVNFPNFTGQENNGKALFLAPPPGGAGCAGCHRAPEFDIDPNSLNNGVITKIGGGTDLTNTRSPSLRDLVGPGNQSNGAFMHDGSKADLIDVINHYNVIPATNSLATNYSSLDNRLRRPGNGNQVQNLNLSQTQKDSLIAFLRTLTGSNVYTDAKWSDPFTSAGELELIILPPSDMTITILGNGTATIASPAASGFTYQLWSSPDLNDWSTLVANVTPNASGVCEQVVSLSENHRFFRFTYTVPTAP
jgi:cytochrome c peroxidase